MQANVCEYLVSYGNAGDFGRFTADCSESYEHGDEVVVRGPLGLETGIVMCRATAGHERFLSRTLRGELLRRVGASDRGAIEGAISRGHQIFEHGRRLVQELGLPLEIVDVESSLDGKQAVVHHLRREECDYRALVSRLSRSFDVFIVMENLAEPQTPPEEGGCGRPDCGKGEGGCGSCGTGGGCGTCGKGTTSSEVSTYLAGLRERMEQSSRTPLL
jgi:hypothetical protein